MLVEQQLFEKVDLVQKAILRLKEFEAQAIRMHPDGYWVAFSGGKDSIVLLNLVKRSGVKYTAHFNVTTVDPPELLRFIRDNYPRSEVAWEKPDRSMFQLIVDKMMLPTRIVRFCCEHLKECGGKGRFVITGIRWAESVKRSKRGMVETCYRDSRTRYLNPIIEWTDADVWQYIRENHLPYCCLYDEGFKRIGCVGCPMAGRGRVKEFARWPKIEKRYRAAAAAAGAKNIRDNGPEYMAKRFQGRALRWETGDAMFNWWMAENHDSTDPDQGVLFE